MAAIAACIASVAVIIFAIVYLTVIGPNHQVKELKSALKYRRSVMKCIWQIMILFW